MNLYPNDDTVSFIAQHRHENVHDLALQASRFKEVDMPFALQQIAGWQTACQKLPRWSNTEGVLYPPHLSMEQCSSEPTALYKAEVASKGESFADLTGGFGVDASYISAGFRQALYVERNEQLCELARHNFPLFGCGHVEVHNAEAETFLQTMKPVTCLFLDPARRDSHGGKTVAISDCTPDVSALSELLLQKAETVMIKLSPMLDITLALKDLPAVREVHVVSVNNECKELLLLMSGKPVHERRFHCINLTSRGRQSFSFTPEDEMRAQCTFVSEIRRYLYEPNSSLLKAGAFRSLAAHYQIEKLHPNSHLYTSDTLYEDFPGRIFEVKETVGFKKKELKEMMASLKQANLTVRNFPASVAELRKRFRLAEGGNIYLFATTLYDESKVIVKCEKI